MVAKIISVLQFLYFANTRDLRVPELGNRSVCSGSERKTKAGRLARLADRKTKSNRITNNVFTKFNCCRQQPTDISSTKIQFIGYLIFFLFYNFAQSWSWTILTQNGFHLTELLLILCSVVYRIDVFVSTGRHYIGKKTNRTGEKKKSFQSVRVFGAFQF